MATRNFVPRADGEGGIGRADKHWAFGYINEIHGTLAGKADNAIVADKATTGMGMSIVDGKLCVTYSEED